MPIVTIDVRQQYPAALEVKIMQAVHAALIDAFKIKQTDRITRLNVYNADHFQCSPDLAQPEYFTLVQIDAFQGRSIQAKRKLYQCIVENLSQLGIPKDHIMIVIREMPSENWGIRGGVAACDVDLGFDIHI